jgi:hypothetical protein
MNLFQELFENQPPPPVIKEGDLVLIDGDTFHIEAASSDPEYGIFDASFLGNAHLSSHSMNPCSEIVLDIDLIPSPRPRVLGWDFSGERPKRIYGDFNEAGEWLELPLVDWQAEWDETVRRTISLKSDLIQHGLLAKD